MTKESDGLGNPRQANVQPAAPASAPGHAHRPVAIEIGPGAGRRGGGASGSGDAVSGGSSGGRGGDGDGGGGAPPPATGAPGFSRHTLAMALAAVVVVGAAAALLMPGKDSVSPQEAQQRVQEFAAAGSIRTERVPPAELAGALDSIPLKADEKVRLKAQLDGGSARLVYLTLWDNVAEDDDRVRIDSATFSFEVRLKNRPTRIAVPEPPSGVLNVVGTRDGGGGITVAMMSGSTTVRLPVMAIGQALGVPVVAAP
ncbi:MAG: hypothetical protein JNM61_09515 [Zoogloeaceae bacterium]|nr:hypothetical protein [Zoogloeaceae bacterium]